MAGRFDIADLRTLDATAVQQNLALLTTLVQRLVPGADLRRGTMRDVVLYINAVIGTAEQVMIDDVLASSSLLAVTADPALADPGVVDRLLSNYRVTRGAAAAASGTVQVILSSASAVTVPSSAVFTANGQSFSPTSSFTSRVAQSSVLSAGDVLLTALGDGTFAFNITVAALSAGAAGNLARGTRLTPASSFSQAFVQAAALVPFSGGADAETNASLLNRLAAGAGARAWSNRMTADALLRGQPAFQAVLDESVIGFGDPEMTRDQHGVWPGSYGGRVDMYVRTQAAVGAVLLPSRPATLVGRDGAGNGLWQFSLGRDDAPGFYAVGRVTQAGRSLAPAGYAVTSDVRGYDNTPRAGLSTPDLTTAAEAAGSRYCTATVQFADTDTPSVALTVGSAVRNYDVVVLAMPLIGQMQDFVSGRAVGAPAGDVLVRAPFPVIVTAALTVSARAAAVLPAASVLQAAAASAVNGLGFGVAPTAADVSAAVLPLLPPGARVSSVSLSGTIRYADNTTAAFSSADVLSPPLSPSNPAVSGRTVGYFLDPADVAVGVVTVDSPGV